MYKLILHPTERKSPPLLREYLAEHTQINKEFLFPWVETAPDLENPDLLVQKEDGSYIPLNITIDNDLTRSLITDHCACEFKFGLDLVSSLNSGLLQDELTRMKAKYSTEYIIFLNTETKIITYIPLYLVIVNEWVSNLEAVNLEDGTMVKAYVARPVISNTDLARAVTIAQNLNIRVKYCDTSTTFAQNVFDLIRKPPKEVDLGQRFVKKSSGSEFNRSLQCYDGVTQEVADKIEAIHSDWGNLLYFLWLENNPLKKQDFYQQLKPCFTTESGRFMQANMAKFLKKVSGS